MKILKINTKMISMKKVMNIIKIISKKSKDIIILITNIPSKIEKIMSQIKKMILIKLMNQTNIII